MKTTKPIEQYTVKESKDVFRKCFESLSHGYDYSTVFGDFLEYSLLMMNINKKAEDFADLEKRWTTPEQHRTFLDMFLHWGNASYDFHDALGDIFMECVSFGRNGQFFTPTEICIMLAKLTIPDDIEDGKSIMDCAAGSGRTLLAAAGINRNLKFYAADNDITCVKMCTLNFLINTMVGEVAHMDSLSMKHYKSYHIKKVRDRTHYVPYYYTTGPNQTDFIQRYQAIQQTDENPKPSSIEAPLLLSKKNQVMLF